MGTSKFLCGMNTLVDRVWRSGYPLAFDKDLWKMSGSVAKALQRPLPDEALKIVARSTSKEDQAAA